jgi:hypothetical protein
MKRLSILFNVNPLKLLFICLCREDMVLQPTIPLQTPESYRLTPKFAFPL